MKRKLWLLLIPFVFVAIPAARYVFAPDEEVETFQGVPVVVGTPQRRSMEESIRYPATLRAESTAVVVPRVAGRVDRIAVELNQRVAAGDLVAELESEMVRIQMEQARAAWQAADAQFRRAQRGAPEEEIQNVRATIEQSEEELANARSNLERTERLYEAGTVSRSDFERAQNEFQAAETQLQNARRSLRLLEQGATEEELAAAAANAEAARKQFQLAELQFEYADVVAPVDGTVSDIMVEAGNTVNVGQPLAAIINDGLIYVSVQVPERHYGRVISARAEEVLAARVLPDAYTEGPSVDARVSSIANTIDPRSRTFEVEVAVENLLGRLRPGMYVQVDLVLDTRPDALSIPSSAVVLRGSERVVFVLSEASDGDRHVTAVTVETGIERGGFVQVTEGLDESARIVVEGNAFLEDGQAVRVVEER